MPRAYAELVAAVDDLTTSPHDFKTLVLDTADRIEKLIWGHLLERDNGRGNSKDGKIESIEDYGYGKGYTKAVDEWIALLAKLDRLRTAKGMEIILVAHATVKSFKNPLGPDYDRFQPAINEKAAGCIKGWADVTGFVCHDDEGAKEIGAGKFARAKGFSTGRHLVKFAHSAAFDAKSRLNLPDEVEVDIADPWAPLAAAVQEAYEDEVAKLTAGIAAEIERIGDEETSARAGAATRKAAEAQDRVSLARILAELKKRKARVVAPEAE